MDEPVRVLSIGSVIGGASAENRAWRDAIGRLSRRVAAARAGIVSPLNVNAVFQVPGAMLKPEFEGVRTGRFSKKDSLLLVQAALPEQLPEDADVYVKQMLTEAILEAEHWAQARGIAQDLRSLRDLAAGL